jgi:hypothetical protein
MLKRKGGSDESPFLVLKVYRTLEKNCNCHCQHPDFPQKKIIHPALDLTSNPCILVNTKNELSFLKWTKPCDQMYRMRYCLNNRHG